MSGLEATFDDRQVVAALDRLRLMMADDTPMLKAIGVGMVRNVQQRMDRGVDPWGRPWVPLQPDYAAMKRGPGILRESGMLQRSITSEVRAGVLVIGSNRPYARIHQKGGVIVPKTQPALTFVLRGPGGHYYPVHAKRVIIPRRAYLGFGIEDYETVDEVVEAFTLRAIRG